MQILSQLLSYLSHTLPSSERPSAQAQQPRGRRLLGVPPTLARGGPSSLIMHWHAGALPFPGFLQESSLTFREWFSTD